MKTYACLTVLVVGLASVGTAAAQDRDVLFFRSGPLDPAGQAGGVAVAGVPFHFELPVDVLAVEPFDAGEPVTGAPYSAEMTTEILQQLADGNRIERRSTSSVARDGEGRVRREQQLAAIGPILPQRDAPIVTINDPVAKVHYSLDLTRKVAIQSPPMFTRKIEGPVRAFPPTAAAAAPETRTEPLGTRDIEGLTAEGTRTVVTIPAGAIGNAAPIEMVSERWYSPELKILLLSRRSDPRFGETTYRLERIVREEPSAELFQVPPDFTIEKGPMMGLERRIIQSAPAPAR
jgi:hypothetical protein